MQQVHSAAATVAADPTIEMAREIAEGFARRPKEIPAKYLYDALGSKLFEAICELPWYRITRGEHSLLAAHAAAIMSASGGCDTVVELGGGSGEKLSVLLAAAGGRQLDVHLVDISPAALAQSALTLAAHLSVTLHAHEADYETGVREALRGRRTDGRALVLFLGSNIGNLSPDQADHFLQELQRACRPGDRLLLGADLVKPEAELLLAYDDPLGLTAAFNKNVLARLNRELDADFDLLEFDHCVEWNAADSRIEVYLVSRADQLVCIRGAGCCTSIDEGERIWTESSYKYEPAGIAEMGARAGFTVREQWIEPESRFALTLFESES